MVIGANISDFVVNLFSFDPESELTAVILGFREFDSCAVPFRGVSFESNHNLRLRSTPRCVQIPRKNSKLEQVVLFFWCKLGVV